MNNFAFVFLGLVFDSLFLVLSFFAIPIVFITTFFIYDDLFNFDEKKGGNNNADR